MNKEHSEYLLKNIQRDNACLIFSSKVVCFSSFIEFYKNNHTNNNKVAVEIQCKGVINFNDLSTSIYVSFLTAISRILDYGAIASISTMIENSILRNLNNLQTDKFAIFEHLMQNIKQVAIERNLELLLIFHDFEQLLSKGNLKHDTWQLRSFFQSNKQFKFIVTSSDAFYTKLSGENAFYKYFTNIELKETNYSEALVALQGIKNNLDSKQIEYILSKLNRTLSSVREFSKLLECNIDNDSNGLRLDKNVAESVAEYIRGNSQYYELLLDKLNLIKHGLYVFKYTTGGFESKNRLISSMFHELEKENTISISNKHRVVSTLSKNGYLVKVAHGEYLPREPLFLNYLMGRAKATDIEDELRVFKMEKRNEW